MLTLQRIFNSMLNKLLMTIGVCIFIFSGCSAQELYEAGQQNRQSRCNEYVSDVRDQCLKELNNKDYEEYEKERQEVLNGEEIVTK